MNTVAFGNQFTDEAEQVHFQCPDEMFQSNDGSFNQSQSSHGFLQQDPALDHYLKDDQERKLLSGTTRFKEMQVLKERLTLNHDFEFWINHVQCYKIVFLSSTMIVQDFPTLDQVVCVL